MCASRELVRSLAEAMPFPFPFGVINRHIEFVHTYTPMHIKKRNLTLTLFEA